MLTALLTGFGLVNSHPVPNVRTDSAFGLGLSDCLPRAISDRLQPATTGSPTRATPTTDIRRFTWGARPLTPERFDERNASNGKGKDTEGTKFRRPPCLTESESPNVRTPPRGLRLVCVPERPDSGIARKFRVKFRNAEWPICGSTMGVESRLGAGGGGQRRRAFPPYGVGEIVG